MHSNFKSIFQSKNIQSYIQKMFLQNAKVYLVYFECANFINKVTNIKCLYYKINSFSDSLSTSNSEKSDSNKRTKKLKKKGVIHIIKFININIKISIILIIVIIVITLINIYLCIFNCKIR